MSCSERERSVVKALSALPLSLLCCTSSRPWSHDLRDLLGTYGWKISSDPHWRLAMQSSKSQNLKVDSKGNGKLTLSRSLAAAGFVKTREQWITKTQTWWNKGMNNNLQFRLWHSGIQLGNISHVIKARVSQRLNVSIQKEGWVKSYTKVADIRFFKCG